MNSFERMRPKRGRVSSRNFVWIEVVLGAILELEHVGTHRLPAPRGLPQLGGLENRHEQFLRARAVHLLAHDRLDLAQRPHAEGQEREQPGGRLFDDRRPDKQLVRVDFSVPRVFPEGLDHHLGPLHLYSSFSLPLNHTTDARATCLPEKPMPYLRTAMPSASISAA